MADGPSAPHARLPAETRPEFRFHDIKPVPDFSPIPWHGIAIGVAFLIIVFLAARVWRGLRRQSAERMPPPLEIALEEIARLELLRRDHRITLRDFSSALSLALRMFLEKRFAFPAGEQTVTEVSASLPQAIRQKLPAVDPDRIDEMTSMVRHALRFLERISFANDSTNRYHLDSTEVVAQVTQSEALVRRLDELCVSAERTETERRQGQAR